MEIFVELSIIIGVTVLIAGITRLLKQPLIIGYILSGIIVSPYFLGVVRSTETISVFSQIGVTFLLFIVGLSLSPRVIKEVGKVSLITGIGQILFTSLIGFFISRALGFSIMASLYIAIALTFSSTIIIMKLLSDKGDLEKLYGKISIGFLLVQDFFAIILLMMISSLSGGNLANISIGNIFKGVLLISIFILVSIYILPGLSKFFAKSQEFLFLFSIGWGLGLATLFNYIGFSMEIGALIAGIALSMSPYHYEISSKMKPLRDFFIILFFILLGSQMAFGNINQLIIPAVIFSLFILIGNPLIVMILMGILGYKKKTGFQAGLTVAQISEFSLILIALGVKVGHLTNEILSLVTVVGLITIAGSTYLILYSDKIYSYLSPYLSVFERKKIRKDEQTKFKNYEIILFGYNRIGYDLLQSFKKLKKKFLVVDYNPDTISDLSRENINCKYGDADDDEFLNELNLSEVKMAVSTIPDFETNLLLINKIKQTNKKAIIVVVAHNIEEADVFYNKGATYVLMPHFLGGSHASMMISKYGLDINKFLEEKEKHIKYLKARKKLGYEHPKAEKHR